jgi:diaminopimelate epimerase
MNIPFWKMHGAGNDFILADDRNLSFPISDSRWIASIASRRTGVGCEGVILIQPSDEADFRMRFFNPDGNEVEMCGNGARCIARLASEIGVTSSSMSIDTVAGIIRAEILEDNTVRLHMTPPSDWKLDAELEIDGTSFAYGFVNSGVPHAVIPIDDLSACDIQALGSAVRHHDAFQPAGTNANFINVTGDSSLDIRTYERGVEEETLACGTGIVASSLIAAKLDMVTAPVTVRAASGDFLTVGMDLTEDGAENVTLLGPATHVFNGTLEYTE